MVDYNDVSLLRSDELCMFELRGVLLIFVRCVQGTFVAVMKLISCISSLPQLETALNFFIG